MNDLMNEGKIGKNRKKMKEKRGKGRGICTIRIILNEVTRNDRKGVHVMKMITN